MIESSLLFLLHNAQIYNKHLEHNKKHSHRHPGGTVDRTPAPALHKNNVQFIHLPVFTTHQYQSFLPLPVPVEHLKPSGRAIRDIRTQPQN